MQILASLDTDKNSSISIAFILMLWWEESEKWLTVRLCIVTKITNRAQEGQTFIYFYFILMINWTCQWKRQTDSTGASKISACDKKEASLKKLSALLFTSSNFTRGIFSLGKKKKLHRVMGSGEQWGCCTYTILCFTKNCWSKVLRFSTDSSWHQSRYHHFIIFTQPLRSGRIWHKVNFKAEFNRFEFRVFLLLN